MLCDKENAIKNANDQSYKNAITNVIYMCYMIKCQQAQHPLNWNICKQRERKLEGFLNKIEKNERKSKEFLERKQT